MNATAVLTRREYQIAEYLAWGACSKEVANICHVSPLTVENTKRNIYEKTGVTKVNELSAWWFCTHFHISFELSPLFRRTMAVFLLGLFFSMFASPDEMLMRSRRAERAARSRREYTYTIEI